ncbi:MAG: peptidylprolyl isomerase [Fimbriimonadaceae bacterium]|nr:peptidylprolyl isomerase [Fimbriimonadaceae bacterium]
MKAIAIATGMLFSVMATAQTVDLNQVVVTVNGEKVLANEYFRRMEYLQVNQSLGDMAVRFTPGFLTIEQLVTERLTMQLAKQKGCFPSDAELQTEYKDATTSNPDLEKNWLRTGRTKEELMAQMRYEMSQFKLQTFGINITDQEVEDFYKKNPTMFTIPKRARLRMIVCSDINLRAKIDSELKAGKKFEDLATQYSEDVTKSVGGDIGWQAFGALSGPVRAELEAIKAGQATNWIAGKSSSVKFFLVEVKQQELQAYDADTKRLLRRRIMLDRGINKNNLAEEMKAFRAKAKIEITNPVFAEQYKGLLDSMMSGG